MKKLIVISAPSGAGKTSIVQYLLKKIPQLSFSISACSRNKRENEIDNHVTFLKFEYKKDHSEKASIQANLISDSSQKLYTYNYIVPYSYFMKIETGYNYKTKRGLNFYTKLGRIQKSNSDFQNIMTIEFSQSF